jgi:NitT/TauT family transport system substrate-binding protein
MKLIKAFIIGLATVLLMEFVFAACAKEPLSPLRVGFDVWPGTESLYLARDLGYYKNTPIKLVDYPSDSELMRAYRNGELEAITITLDDAWSLAQITPDFRIVLIMDISNGGDGIVAKPEIKKLQALKGRRVGVESTALEAFVLSRALGQVGMSSKDVQIISLLASGDEQPFKQGSIDAVVTYEPTLSKLRATGANLLFDSRQIPGEIMDILAIRENVLTGQPSAAQALITGWFRALDYLQKHPSDAARRIASHSRVTPLEFLESLNSIRIPNVQQNKKILGKTDAASLNAASQLAKFMVKKNLLKKAVDPTSMFDTRLINDVEVSMFKNK